MRDQFLHIVNCLLYDSRVTELQNQDVTVITYIFEDMLCEAIDHYTQLFEIFPLESLNPAIFAQYLPPGRN